MRKIFLGILLWTWCLPQSLLGVFFYLCFRNKILKKKNYRGITIYYVDTKLFGGFSSGKFIFIGRARPNKKITLKHEYGHTIQSYVFGPLYLLVIGLPSVIMFWISKFNKKFKRNYLKRFPEDEANDLGKVKKKD